MINVMIYLLKWWFPIATWNNQMVTAKRLHLLAPPSCLFSAPPPAPPAAPGPWRGGPRPGAEGAPGDLPSRWPWWMVTRELTSSKMAIDVEINSTYENRCVLLQEWWFSTSMLVYRRVSFSFALFSSVSDMTNLSDKHRKTTCRKS